MSVEAIVPALVVGKYVRVRVQGRAREVIHAEQVGNVWHVDFSRGTSVDVPAGHVFARVGA